MDPPAQTSPSRRPQLHTFLALFGACGIGIAQPALDVVSQSPTFLVAHGISGARTVLFGLAIVVVPPVVLTLVVAALRALWQPLGTAAEVAAVAVLLGLAFSAPLSRVLASRPGLAILLIAAFVIAAGMAYARSALARRYVRVLAFAPVIIAAWFILLGPAKVVGGTSAVADDPAAAAPDTTTPVVHVVLDEFALGSILTPDGEIDGDRFPNFARLADASTWYANATTNANATRLAVPASLTGRFPPQRDVAPSEANYPRNLFTLLDRTHALHVSETVTGLCSSQRCHGSVLPFSSAKHVIADTTLVYLHRVLPPRLARALPSLPERAWGGFFADPLGIEQRVAQVPRAVRGPARWLLSRLADDDATPYSVEVRRFDAFVDSIRAGTDEPGLWFHHALLPHHPWHLTEDARPYDAQETPGERNGRFATRQDGDAALQRYMIQARATDAMIGRLIDRMRRVGIWDDAVLAVHADHGVAFEPGIPFRSMTQAPDDVLPIPFFVRLPGQRRGAVDRTNVELVDVLPTIARAAGAKLHAELDGVALQGSARRDRKRAWAGSGTVVRALEPFDGSSLDATSMAGHLDELFGAARERDDLYAWGPHAELVGRRTPDGLRSCRGFSLDRPGRFQRFDGDGPFVPVRVTGTLRGEAGWVAVAVNGRIAGLGRPFGSGDTRRFAVMASPRMFRDGRNAVDVFRVRDGDVGCDVR